MVDGNVSAMTVFLAIAGLGFLFLAISFLFGEIFDFLGGYHEMDAGDGPSPLSGKVLSVFITAFGGAGALATHFGFGVSVASLGGFASGVVFGGAIYWFGKLLYRQQSSTDVGGHDMLWRNALVTVAIPAGGLGQIRLQIGEEIVDKIARSKSGDAIPANVTVMVDDLVGEIAIVVPES